MSEIRLQWSPSDPSSFLVIPGQRVRYTNPNARPFEIHHAKLVNPELFNQASLERDWPRLSIEDHSERVRFALASMDLAGFDSLPVVDKCDLALTVIDLLDATITLEECCARFEGVVR